MTLAIAIAANIALIAGLVALLAYAMTRPTVLVPHAGEPQARTRRRAAHRDRPVREAPRTSAAHRNRPAHEAPRTSRTAVSARA